MNISSVTSNSNIAAAALQQQSATNATERSSREPENDGDKDDGAIAVKAPSPTVNLNGQTTGAVVNTTA
jgi:hypothetical protein